MASCGSLENPKFLESLSPWKCISSLSPTTRPETDIHKKARNESPNKDSRPEPEVTKSLYEDVCKEEQSREGSMGKNHHHRIDQFNKRSRVCRQSSFPPPISCIGRRSGKPWVCFKSYREGGRFILKEIRIPTQEFLHACREDGRLRLQFVQSSDDDDGGDVDATN